VGQVTPRVSRGARLRGRLLAVGMVSLTLVGAASMRAGLPLHDVPRDLPTTWRGVLRGWVGDTERSAGQYRILDTHADHSPVTWSDTSISYRIDESFSAEDERAIREAFSATAEATGYRFSFQGRTSFEPTLSNLLDAPAQIVVSLTPRNSSTVFGDTPGDALAVGFSLIDDGRRIRGAVVLDAEEMLRGRGLQRLVMHEIGHVLGLGHTDDATQVMAARLQKQYPARWGTGDLDGLRALASAGR